MSQVLVEAARQETASRETAERDFENLARRLAAQDNIALTEVERIRLAAGKPVDQLRSRAGYHARRNALRAKITAAQDGERERRQLEQQQAQANAVFAAAREAHQKTSWAVEARLAELTELDRQAFQARNELSESFSDERLAAAVRHNRARLAGIERKVRDASEQVRQLERLLDSEKASRQPGANGKWLRENEGYGGDAARVSTLQKRLDTARGELSALRATQSELLAESQQLREQQIWI